MSYQIRERKTDKIIGHSEVKKKILKNFKSTGLNPIDFYLCEVKIVDKKYHILENSIKNL